MKGAAKLKNGVGYTQLIHTEVSKDYYIIVMESLGPSLKHYKALKKIGLKQLIMIGI